MGRSIASWLSVGAAVRGFGHEREGLPCQDQVLADGAIPAGIALADGAGSASHSEQGARCAVETALEALRRADGAADIGLEVIDAIQARLTHLAEEASEHPRAFASTLLAVVVGPGRFVAVHLGDGVVGISEKGELRVLSPPDRGEFANETYFVTGGQARERIRVYTGEAAGVDGFVLMSDGTAASFYDLRADRLAPAVQKLGQWLSEHPPSQVTDALTRSLAQQARAKTSDDCSLALLWRVVMPVGDLAQRSDAFRRAFLGCRTRRSLAHRSALLEAVANQPGISVAELAALTGLSHSGVRYHLRAIRQRVVQAT